MATLYIVATPIGNLQDITFRAIDVLKNVDLILCEDTRVTRRLLDHYGIGTPVLSYHQHSRFQKIDHIIDLLSEGKDLALVSDAGTPGICDPGNLLVEAAIEKLGEKVRVVPIPGAIAICAAASVSGFPVDRFLFLGFPPQKKKRNKFFEEVVNSSYPVIFFESPYRIVKTLEELKTRNPELKVVASRELTKKFETILRGKIGEVLDQIKKGVIKGEFTIVVRGK
ncbi:MAG: 16S rRNA (cytidine(1402)-2'-O)-methyltransferase [Candidatus Nealsonbacteria bacterium]|nr:16S rRNA (cytidine(1402)-2'-O)-methyltransferase [Candidatus Nealsonbacteria bacterium]